MWRGWADEGGKEGGRVYYHLLINFHIIYGPLAHALPPSLPPLPPFHRNISRFTGAKVTGVTINKYQVARGNELNAQAGLEKTCKSVQGDFMELPFPDSSFDGVYAIEATCHAPDRTKVFAEIYRVLKPGQMFACYEWCLTGESFSNLFDLLIY